MKILKTAEDRVEGTVNLGGSEVPFTAYLDGRLQVAYEVQGPKGYAILDLVGRLEAGGQHPAGIPAAAPVPTTSAAAPSSPEAPSKPVAASAAPAPTTSSAPPAPKTRKKKADAAPPAPVPVPAPADPEEGLPDPTEGATEEEAAEYTDEVAPPAPPTPPPAPTAPKAQVVKGTEPYVDPSKSSDEIPAHIWGATDWVLLAPAFVTWCFDRKGYTPTDTLESVVEDVVREAQRILPTLPLAKGAKPQTFTAGVLKAMLGKPVRNEHAQRAA